MICRSLRLKLVAALGVALAMPALSVAAPGEQGLATQTTLNVGTRVQNGRTLAAITVAVTGEDGLPARGAVVLSEEGKQLAGIALNAQGQATTTLALPAGDHLLRATYAGDASHQGSSSLLAKAQLTTPSTPNFTVSVTPASVSLTAGQSQTLSVSVTPENASALTSPLFITLSCSGLPDQSSCTFTPETVEILPNATAALPSSMVLETQAQGEFGRLSPASPRTKPVTWALLFPGAVGLGGLAWNLRRRPWLNRLTLLALVALVTMLGTTACNPHYYYYNHGPPTNLPTPTGTYTLTITAQSSNGVTAITNSTTMVLTVK